MARGSLYALGPAGTHQEYKVAYFLDFRAGLNDWDTNDAVKDDQAVDCLNVLFQEVQGAVQRRSGSLTLNPATADVQRVTSLLVYKTTPHLLKVTADGVLKKVDLAAGAETSLKTGLTAGSRFSGDTYLTRLYFGNGVDGLLQYDGTAVTAVAGAPQMQFIVRHGEFLFGGGDPNNPNRLYFCALGDPSSWPALNYMDVGRGMGDPMTGIAEGPLGSLHIFTRHSTWTLHGSTSSDFQLKPHHGSYGCISHWALKMAHNYLIVPTWGEGIFGFDGNQFHQLLPHASATLVGLNQTKHGQACAEVFGNKYLLALTSGNTQNDTMLVLEHSHGWGWTKFDWKTSSLALVDNGGTMQLFGGSTTDGKVRQLFTGVADDAADVVSFFKTRGFDLKTPDRFKRFKQMTAQALVISGGNNLTVIYDVDFGVGGGSMLLPLGPTNPPQWGSALWGSFTWGGIAGVNSKSQNVPRRARYIAFRVSGTGQFIWTFRGVTLRYQITEAR